MRFVGIALVLVVIMLEACSPSTPAGEPVFVANSNVSFVWAASPLKQEDIKGLMIGNCTDGQRASAESGEVCFTADSSAIITTLVEVNTLILGSNWSLNSQAAIDDIKLRNPKDATIEKLTVDTVSKTVELDCRVTQRGKPYFMKSVAVYGRQRRFNFWFSVPDNTQMRSATIAARMSISIKPEFINGATH